MKKYNTRLSATEMSALWTTYIQDSMSACFLKYFLHHLQDGEIKPIVEKALFISQQHMEDIKNIFLQEDFPIPHGFSNDDINLSAPPIYNDTFALSFVYGMSRIGLVSYGMITSTIARDDALTFFSNCLRSTNELYEKSTKLMLEKGIYDRPPQIPYPQKVEFVDKQSFLTGWFGDRRPINSIELTNIFFNIERNYFATLLLVGFTQVATDKNIKQYFTEGRILSEKQIVILNDILKAEDLLGTVPVRMEVTDSTISPFSDRLMMFLVTSLSAAAITFIGSSISASARRDLGVHYSRIMLEIIQYTEDGTNLMIDRGWMQQPPQAPNRKSLVKS
jgi:hypothetical protein